LAVDVRAPLKYKNNPIFSRAASFQRKNGNIKTKKIQRKIKLKSKHILLAFILLTGVFYGIQRLYLFLITWDKLIIKEVKIVCEREDVYTDVRHFFKGKYLGNILLLNIEQLQNKLASHRWVKDVHIRKIFPSTIRIDLQERIPTALLKDKSIHLIDRDGVRLDPADSNNPYGLPLLVDANLFRKDYEQKLKLAWACLDSLKISDRNQIVVLDLSEYENVSLLFKDSKTWLKLGNGQFAEKIKIYRNNTVLFDTYGSLEYIDFRCPGRLYLGRLPDQERNISPDSGKEVF
jgi:cell division septal protein FtsQ